MCQALTVIDCSPQQPPLLYPPPHIHALCNVTLELFGALVPRWSLSPPSWNLGLLCDILYPTDFERRSDVPALSLDFCAYSWISTATRRTSPGYQPEDEWTHEAESCPSQGSKCKIGQLILAPFPISPMAHHRCRSEPWGVWLSTTTMLK